MLGIAEFGARIGYLGARSGQHIAKNLQVASQQPDLLCDDSKEGRENDRITIYESRDKLT